MTVIIMPVASSAPTTTEFRFLVDTDAGREAYVTVTVPVGTTRGEVLKDLQRSAFTSVRDAEEAESPGGVFFGAVLIWLTLALVGFIMAAVLMISGLYDPGYRSSFWSDYLPLIGGQSFWNGLFRIWIVLTIPAVYLLYRLLRGK